MKKLLISMLAIVSLQTAEMQSAAWVMPAAWTALKASGPTVIKGIGYASAAATAVAGYYDAKAEIKAVVDKADNRAAQAVAVGTAAVNTANHAWNLAQILLPKYGVDLAGLTTEQREAIGLSGLKDTVWYKRLLNKSGYWVYGVLAATVQQIAAQAIQNLFIHGINSAVGVTAAAVGSRHDRSITEGQGDQRPESADSTDTSVTRRRMRIRRR